MKPMNRKAILGEKGMILISAYLTLTVIGTFELALFSKQIAMYRAAERTRNRIIAFHEAESGLDQAIVQLRTNLNFPGTGYNPFANGGFDIQVQTPDPVGSPNLRLITVNGHTPNNLPASYAYERRQVIAHVDFTPPSDFDFALFGNTSVTLSGNARTDSYNSSNGRPPFRNNGDFNGAANGDVGTNATGVSCINLTGNARVRGDAVIGPGGNTSTCVTTSGNAVVEGSRSAAAALKALNPVTIPSSLVNLGNLSASGNTTITQPGGTYWYSTISISGNGRVNFSGPATVYVSGQVSISGNGFGTASNLPPHLIIKVAGSANVSLSGNGRLYAAIYAPQSQVAISGNGDLLGAVVGNTLTSSGNSRVHYDEALRQASSGGGVSNGKILAWTET